MNIYKQEFPKSRVNITLDVNTHEGLRKKELPFKLLVLGNFSGSEPLTNSQGQERIGINIHTFNQVLKKISPQLHLLVEDKLKTSEDSCLRVDLQFEKLQDFRPENIMQQVPRLKNLLAMRNLLKELKAHMAANPSLRSCLTSLGQDRESLLKLQQQLLQLSQNAVTEEKEIH